jgi:3-oxoadipate enol-lactonase
MQAMINGIRMNFEVSGSERNPAIVLHHSLATNLSLWDELTAALSPRYRVVRFDARGHGRTEAPDGNYDFETLTADAVALMDHLGLQRPHYLGLSMGGMVGQYLGFLYPDRVASLLLVSTTSRVPSEAQPLWDERVKLARAQGMASQPAIAMPRWVTAATMKDKPAVVARLRTMIETTPLPGYLGWCAAIRALDVTERLNAITLPTRVIVGSEDPGTTVAAAQTIHRHIKGSELIVMQGVSHMLCAEDPAAFHGHVLSFLDQQAAKAS